MEMFPKSRKTHAGEIGPACGAGVSVYAVGYSAAGSVGSAEEG